MSDDDISRARRRREEREEERLDQQGAADISLILIKLEKQMREMAPWWVGDRLVDAYGRPIAKDEP